MREICFASGNDNKFSEISDMVKKEYNNQIKITFKKIEIIEIQSTDIFQIAEDKIKKAFQITKMPTIIEDDGFYIQQLNGFPGTYASYIFNTIGNDGILKLLEEKKSREAFFLSVYSFFDGSAYTYFDGKTIGKITKTIIPSGWGFDPIFIPEGESITFGQMDKIKKNKISHRSKAFRKFLSWYLK